MKINLEWLRDFVAVDSSGEELAEELTLAGLEVDSVEPAGGRFSGVRVARILDKQPHPNADRLSICRIDDGERELEIVCGAPNAATGISVPFAPVGTELPGGLKIKAAKIRGVRSEGMLCSAKELGLADDAAGLLVLDSGAPAGADLREYLRLDDEILDIDLTPNRGDCFSVLGIAREIAARRDAEPLDEALDCTEATTDQSYEVNLVDTSACARFAGRVISGIATGVQSPDWLRERLRRAGLRAIHPVVDVTNYVMLEYGQPLHAYRLDRLDGPVTVRFARAKEQLTLLDGNELTLDDDVVVIADDSGAIGLAGIMGGLHSAVDDETDTIFFESAWFSPQAIQGRARRYGMHTDASVRFERGVDPSGQERAIERATSLLLEIAGGAAGPLVLAEDPDQVPARKPVTLRQRNVASRLGIDISVPEMQAILHRLGMEVEIDDDRCLVTPPSYRFDIAIEEDLVEEIGRMVGYDRIPVIQGSSSVVLGKAVEGRVNGSQLSDSLVARGYIETISYGFTRSAELARLTGEEPAIRLANPISRDLDVLRSSLWPGLLRSARINQSHQMTRCRLFESGTVFLGYDDNGNVIEREDFAALVTGSRQPAHWDATADALDYFDLKGDIESLLSQWRCDEQVSFRRLSHPALKPGRSAGIFKGEHRVGWLGELHPALQNEYDFKKPVSLFEFDIDGMGDAALPAYSAFSKFPVMRRDLAVVVDEETQVADLTKRVAGVLGEALLDHEVFDIYRGVGVDTGRKSVGIGLILQDASRTLTDQETDEMINEVIRHLEREFGATIRS